MAITRPPTVIVPDGGLEGIGPALPLPDGRIVQLRTVPSCDGIHRVRVTPDDPDGRVALLFLTLAPDLDGDVDRMLQSGDDGHRRLAVIATVGHELVGVGCLEGSGSGPGEATVVVAEGLRGLGIERALSGTLAARGRREGTS